MISDRTRHPDFATMRTSLRELNEASAADALFCPNATCDGSLRTVGGLLLCRRCAATR